MIQAAAEGTIDFSEADILDPYWWKKLRWSLAYLGRKNRARLFEAQLSRQFAVLDYNTDPATFDHHWGAASLLHNRLSAELMPWMDTGPTEPVEIAAQLRAQWVETWGDPKDPKTDAEVERLIAHWKGRDAT